MTNPENLLGNETSPYLLQHADNPVNWHPWNEQALQLARDENKPVLLSIGYSACHWCHVMAHESFEDEKTARLMNALFINIKVDREERPDLDKIYQTAHSLLTSRPGGWPLTIFLSPHNQMPFFAGTYFPDRPRYNMPSFTEILQLVSDAYQNKRDEIEQQDDNISRVLQQLSSHTISSQALSSLPLDLARKQLENAYDSVNGGFSTAPKFPHSDMVERCLRHYLQLAAQNKPDSAALAMAVFTLNKMSDGGFQDHIGGGFFRYSTDDKWMIPHFEKMLYDNAQLLPLYAQAYALTGSDQYASTAIKTAEWIMREMQGHNGGYFSALDADTDKVEGKTYVWTPEEIKSILDSHPYSVFVKKYGLSEPANFEGKWHLHSYHDNRTLADIFDLNQQDLTQLISSSLDQLRLHRDKRKQPGRDDKILCAWNALMLRGMSIAGRHCQRKDFIESAFAAAEFIRTTLWKNKRLIATCKDGKAHLNAYLDDYAYLLQAILELLQSEWRMDYFQWSMELADALLEHFEDKEQGGFYFTSHDHEQLLYRSKTFADDAMPNGNAVAARALLQLGLLSGRTHYIDAVERTLRCALDELNEHALGHCSLLHALENFLNPSPCIILRGTAENIQQWREITDRHFIPDLYCLAIETDKELAAELADKKPQGDICAYLCEGTQCRPIITDLNDYRAQLKSLSPGSFTTANLNDET